MTPFRAHSPEPDPSGAAAKAAPAATTRPARSKAAVAPAVYTAEDIQILIGVSPITLDRMIASGDFPRPMTPRHKKRRWLRRTVDAWLSEAEAEAERSPRARRR